MSPLCPRTSTWNNVRRAGSSFLPQLCFRLGLQHGRAPNIADSFFARCESLVLGGWRSMTRALSGQQMTLPVSVGVFSCLSFGHSAWFTPRSGRRKCSVRRAKNENQGLWYAFSDEWADAQPRHSWSPVAALHPIHEVDAVLAGRPSHPNNEFLC